MIDFAQPAYFALGLLVLAMAAGVWLTGLWRRRARTQFAGPQAPRWGGSGWWIRAALLLASASLIALAAARPQWGSTETFREREGVDYVIALDISQSMLANDVEPSRLAVAQEELIRLVESERGSRIGLVIFAGSAFLRSPLTSDTQAMVQLIRRAGSEAGLVRGGSDLGAALDTAGIILAASERERGKAVILVSDGEDHVNSYTERAESLRQRGITVLTAGVGTTTGAQLFVTDFAGQVVPMLDVNNQPIISRLDESTLRQIADATGGRYQSVAAGSRSLLGLRIDLRGLDPSPIGAERSIIPIERFQYFIAMALILLTAAWFLPARLPLPRLRRVRPNPALAALVLAVALSACGGDAEDSLRARNEEANALFAAGDYQGALEIYQELLAERPDVDEISYNAGNTLHRLEEYERAVDATSRGLPPRQVDLGVQSYFALGNHLLFLGRYEEAYAAYRQALLLDPDDADSKHNLELTLRLALAQQDPSGEQPPPGLGTPQAGQGEPGDDATPQPGSEEDPSGEPDPNASPQDGTPQSGQSGNDQQPPGTPPTTPQPGASIERTLEEALAGIDEDVSFEEALDILELLRQRQQTPRPAPGGASSGPAY